MPGESLFDPDDPEVRRRQAQNLLNDYSHPWDALAEGLQNSVDAINRAYRKLLALELGVSLDDLIAAIELSSTEAIDTDLSVHDSNYNLWASEAYKKSLHSTWCGILATKLGIDKGAVEGADTRVKSSYAGRIELSRKMNARTLTIRDNGIGMSFADFRRALKKGVTFKSSTRTGLSEIGEMGNGLTYMVCACDHFEMRSSDSVDVSQVIVQGMYGWIQDVGGRTGLPEPLSDPTTTPMASAPFTEVNMSQIRVVQSDYLDLFDLAMTTTRLAHLIRTRTAVGHLYSAMMFPVFDVLGEGGIVVSLTDDLGGSPVTVNIEFSYHSMPEIVAETSPGTSPLLLSKDEANDALRQHRDIGGNALCHRGIFTSATGMILYYLSFISDREWYRRASLAKGYCDNPGGDLKTMGLGDLVATISLGVRGMPTGVTVDPPVTGFQGYWPNFDIMILDNRLRFDEGRKTPVGRRVTLYRDCAEHALFGEFGTTLVSAAIKDPVIALNLAQMATEKQNFIARRLKGRKPLNQPKVPFVNVPREEQDVVAIFHELIAAGILPYYHCLDCSSHGTYDSVFDYQIPKNMLGTRAQLVFGNTGTLQEQIVAEYKTHGEDVILDIAKNVKFYYMMDLLICWDIDAKSCQKLSASVVPKPFSDVKYWGTTHELQLSSSHFMSVGSGRALDVVSLNELLKLMSAKKYKVP